MESSLLSIEAEKRIDLLLPPDQQEQVRHLLQEECGSNLSLPKQLDHAALDRFRFAALKLSDGNINALQSAVRLGKEDWRDLLVAAGFADDIHAHKAWVPERRW
jgi:hypothetical protein